MNQTLPYPSVSADPAQALLIPSRTEPAPLIVFFAGEDLAQSLKTACSRLRVPHFHLLLVSVNDWNSLLSVWPANDGKTVFAGHADVTRAFLQDHLLPWALSSLPQAPSSLWLGGYSLGGLYVLWDGLQSNQFEALLCISGSVWFPEFEAWAKKQPVPSSVKSIYFSLGTKEVKTANPQLQKTGEIMENLSLHFQQEKLLSTFVWNPGTHFTEIPRRIALGLSWTFSALEQHNNQDR